MSLRLALALLVLFPSLAEARDRAVLIYPRERSGLRRVFYTSHQRSIRQGLARDYALTVYEQVGSDDELFSSDIDGAKLLVLSAHGDPFSMHFANQRSRTLDSSDRVRL